MAITTETVFDIVRIGCNCRAGSIGSITPYNGTTPAIGAESLLVHSTDPDDRAQLEIMHQALLDGDADPIYQDSGTPGSPLIAYDDLPKVFAQVHYQHWLHPTRGWEFVDVFVKEAGLQEDSETGRRDFLHNFGLIPQRRATGNTEYDYSLGDLDVLLLSSGTRFFIYRYWPLGQEVEAPNDEDEIVALRAWLESIRIDGDPFGDDILTLTDLTGRTVRIVQGPGAATLDMQITSVGVAASGTPLKYTQVGISLERITGETGAFDLAAMRNVLATTTVEVAVGEDDEVEEPEHGSLRVAHRAREVHLPGGYKIVSLDGRIGVAHAEHGTFPLDGQTVQSARFASLANHSDGPKLMPLNGVKIVHFGHAETSDRSLRFREAEWHMMANGYDTEFRVDNVSTMYTCTVRDKDNDTLIKLHPGQSCVFQMGLDSDGSAEILVVDPPFRRLRWSRGIALPRLMEDQRSYAEGTGDDPVHYRTLPFPTTGSGVPFNDSEAFTLGSSDPTAITTIGGVGTHNWDIPGSFVQTYAGPLYFDITYRLQLLATDGETLVGSLAEGHGASLWISEGGTGTLTRKFYRGKQELGGEGAYDDYQLTYDGEHSAGTRFLILHRVPPETNIGDWDHVKMQQLEGFARYKPVIRRAI